MPGFVRKLSPLPMGLPALNVLSYATATAYPCGISADRKSAFGFGSSNTSILYESTDDGVTWTSVHTFSEQVKNFLELDDGEALVSTQNATSAPGYLYKSSGWSSSHTAATWTKVLTSSGGYFAQGFTMSSSSFGNDLIRSGSSKYVVVNEYGTTTTSSGDQSTRAIHVYWSEDYGATWRMILDMSVRYPGVSGIHLHSSVYDPWFDRIFVTYGDTTPAGNSKMKAVYSDDHGGTWNDQPTVPSSEWPSATFQSTAVMVHEDGLIIGSDNGPGALRLSRVSSGNYGLPQPIYASWGNSNAGLIGYVASRNRNHPGAPIWLGIVPAVSELYPSIVVSPDGMQFYEVWRDIPKKGDSNSGPYVIVGPTANGVMLATLQQSATTWQLLRAELVPGEARFLDLLLSGTGDGTTTAFTVAHGLGRAPQQAFAFAQDARSAVAGIASVTADATNVTVTYTTAPTVGTFLTAVRVLA